MQVGWSWVDFVFPVFALLEHAVRMVQQVNTKTQVPMKKALSSAPWLMHTLLVPCCLLVPCAC
jgi:hypothetical protein